MVAKCMIVDDEPLALDLLESYVRRTPSLELVGRYSSPVEALAAVRDRPVDLLFLDIQMPELSGIELSRIVGEKVGVIFTTAFQQYALEGFRVDAWDYLLKPVSYIDFLQAVEKAAKRFHPREATVSEPPAGRRTIFVKSNYKLIQIDLDRVFFIEGMKDYVKIHTEEEVITTLMTLKQIETHLPASVFIRVHRSFIVNMDQVRLIDRNRIVFGKTYIPVSDSYRERFNRLMEEKLISC